jgi:hypothetical protein
MVSRLSAQVILRPPGGPLSGHERITSENVRAFLPSEEAVAATTTFFREAGFDVSEGVGLGFSITGSPADFERTFGERPEWRLEAGVEAVRTVAENLELPLDTLPEPVRRHIQAVAFTPPPDFGPTNP